MPRERNYRDSVEAHLSAWSADLAQARFYGQRANGNENGASSLPSVDDKKVEQLMGFLRVNNGGVLWVSGNDGQEEMVRSRAQAVALGFVLKEIITNLDMPLRIASSPDKGYSPIAEQIADVARVPLGHDFTLDLSDQAIQENIENIWSSMANVVGQRKSVEILVTPMTGRVVELVRGKLLELSGLGFLALGSSTQDGRRHSEIFSNGIFKVQQPTRGF